MRTSTLAAIVGRRAPFLFAFFLLAFALAISAQGIALAQQAPQLVSKYAKTLPVDPTAAAWQEATPLDVPLTPQNVALPRLPQVSVPTVSVRSLNDGKQAAFRLEWADTTRDAHATKPDEFRDAAAILFPVGDFLPNICMGVAGQLTNLWHWKADWQEDIDKGYQEVREANPNLFKDSYNFVTGTPPFRLATDFGSAEARQFFPGLAAGNPIVNLQRTSPIEELLSAGFGTATSKAQQAVQGRGQWADGRWSVVFIRDLQAGDADSATLAQGKDVSMAFAVWNGANQEVGARKQLSSFVTLRVAGEQVLPPTKPPAIMAAGLGAREPLIAGGVVLVLTVVGLAAHWDRQREVARARAAERERGQLA
jgi:hypothetical protein